MDKSEQLEVSQADRDAAANIWRDYVARVGECIAEKAIREGASDCTMIVQAFARHRQATEARMAAAVEAERERCARIASLMQPHPDAAEFEHWSDGFECATVAIAAKIRSQSNG